MKTDRIATAALGLATLVMTGLGVVGLFAPAQLLGPMGFSLSNAASWNQARVDQGAVHLALAGFFAFGALRQSARGPALALLAAMTGGILAIRFASLGIDGLPGPAVYKPMLVEIVMSTLAVAALVRARVVGARSASTAQPVAVPRISP